MLDYELSRTWYITRIILINYFTWLAYKRNKIRILNFFFQKIIKQFLKMCVWKYVFNWVDFVIAWNTILLRGSWTFQLSCVDLDSETYHDTMICSSRVIIKNRNLYREQSITFVFNTTLMILRNELRSVNIYERTKAAARYTYRS